MKTSKFDFYKEEDGKWYAQIDSWTGDYADLEMIAGADTFLDLASSDGTHATLSFSTSVSDKFPIVLAMSEHDEYGAFYRVENCDFYDGYFYLCNVAEWVIGEDHPETIYVRVE